MGRVSVCVHPNGVYISIIRIVTSVIPPSKYMGRRKILIRIDTYSNRIGLFSPIHQRRRGASLAGYCLEDIDLYRRKLNIKSGAAL